jgi:hypothetical protein
MTALASVLIILSHRWSKCLDGSEVALGTRREENGLAWRPEAPALSRLRIGLRDSVSKHSELI